MGKKKIMKEDLMYSLFGDYKRSMLILSAIVSDYLMFNLMV